MIRSNACSMLQVQVGMYVIIDEFSRRVSRLLFRLGGGSDYYETCVGGYKEDVESILGAVLTCL